MALIHYLKLDTYTTFEPILCKCSVSVAHEHYTACVKEMDKLKNLEVFIG